MKKALIVDDVEVSRYILRGYLEDMSYEVSEANSIEQAQDYLSRSTFDVVILDWFLRNKTVHDLIKAIRTSKSSTARLVVLSGVANESEVEDIKKLAIDCYMGKPATKDKLRQLLGQ